MKNNIHFNIKKVNCKGYTYFRIQKQVAGNKINVTGSTKQNVTDKFYQKLTEIQNQDFMTTGMTKMTFGEFTHYYLYDVVEPTASIKDSTLKMYISFYNKHIKNSNISNTKLLNINRENLQFFFNSILKKGLKVSTIKQIKIFISIVLNYAIDGDIIIKNYCSSIKLPKNDEPKKYKFLSNKEIKLLPDKCNSPKLKIIIITALNTGMRINEILALTQKDIDFTNNIISVNKNLSQSRNGVIITTTKTKSSNRDIPINIDLTNSLKQHISKLKKDMIKIGIILKQDMYIFTSKGFKPALSNSYTRNINALYKCCEINTKGFHVLRHTYGSKLYEHGVDIKTISELLGHSNTNITSKVYVHLKSDAKKNAVSLLSYVN